MLTGSSVLAWEMPMDRGAWLTEAHRVARSQTQLKCLSSQIERFSGEGTGDPLQYSCLEDPMERSLVGCSPWGREESDTTERLHFHFSLSCTGEGNGNPFQCFCLENPRDSRAWWAAIYGVAQSRTQLKRLSSSSREAFQVAGVVENLPVNAGDLRDAGSVPGSTPWRRASKPTPVFLPGEFHVQGSLAGSSPWHCKESGTSEVT